MKFFTKKALIIYIVIIAIAAGGFFMFKNGESQNITTIKLKPQTLVQEVVVTGNVKPIEDLELSFDLNGRVAKINKKTGDSVKRGEVIASLENGDLFANLEQARANLRLQQATLQEVLRGTRKEEIDLTKADLKKAEQDLLNDYNNIPEIIKDALLDSEDALNKQTFNMFSDPNGKRPELVFFVTDFQSKVDAETNRVKANAALSELRNTSNNLSVENYESLEISLSNTKLDLEVINEYLDSLFDALTFASGISETTKDTYKTNVVSAQNNIISSLTAVKNKLDTIKSQKLIVEKIKKQLDLQLSGATEEEIEKAKARVDDALAQVEKAKASLNKTLIISPINGIISKLDISVGETVTVGSKVVNIVSSGGFKIEADIPEVDISKIKIGDRATITLDAYGSSEKFLGKVTQIEPAARIIEGVPTYRTTLEFLTPDERIKPGMTANITIETARKDNVLAIPQRAIITKDNKKFVKVIQGDQIKEVEITTGLKGTGGLIEITSGLNEGDEVITFIKEP